MYAKDNKRNFRRTTLNCSAATCIRCNTNKTVVECSVVDERFIREDNVQHTNKIKLAIADSFLWRKGKRCGRKHTFR